MAWKTVCTREGIPKPAHNESTHARGVYANDAWLYVDYGGAGGKRIRVTVEEEVSECCEKWRGHYIDRSGPMMLGMSLYISSMAVFCPECGKKL